MFASRVTAVSVFQGYRLTRLGPLLPVWLEVGIHHDLFEHHTEA